MVSRLQRVVRMDLAAGCSRWRFCPCRGLVAVFTLVGRYQLGQAVALASPLLLWILAGTNIFAHFADADGFAMPCPFIMRRSPSAALGMGM